MREISIGLIGMSCAGGSMYLYELGKTWPGVFFMILVFISLIVLQPEELEKKIERTDKSDITKH